MDGRKFMFCKKWSVTMLFLVVNLKLDYMKYVLKKMEMVHLLMIKKSSLFLRRHFFAKL